ncbi:MAG: hypothetical protein B6242_08505 [Anaerolineaceae bacterium 4572_78]|nr:MAG: hypothetical protein B6242_08505 [Anaerolineaceae bacterium 4572_78]
MWQVVMIWAIKYGLEVHYIKMEIFMTTIPIPDHIPEDDHWWFASRTRLITVFMQQVLPQTHDLDILDIGCGAGNMIHHLSKYGQVRGLEIDPRPVKQALLRDYDIYQQDATQGIAFTDNMYDVVTAFDVIEHVDDDMAILQESYRILKPHGHIVVTVPAFMWLWSHNDDINDHKRRYTADELKDKLKLSGFQLNRISYNNFFIFPLAAPLVMLRRGNEPELASHHLDEDEYQVEMEPTSPIVNSILTVVGKIESQLARLVSLPFGTSLIAIAQKTEDITT